MGGAAGQFGNLTWLSLIGAVFAIYNLKQHWPEFRANRLTPRSRQIAAMLAFFLLVPVGVLLHEFGHMLAAWTTSSQVLGLHYFFYYGYVEYIPSSSSPLQAWYIALAGNAVSYLLGIGCIAAALYRRLPIGVNYRVALLQLGVLELVQTLIAYPLLSLDPNFAGDWDTIYSFQAPIASGITLAVHLVSLAVFIWFIRSNEKSNYLLGVAQPTVKRKSQKAQTSANTQQSASAEVPGPRPQV